MAEEESKPSGEGFTVIPVKYITPIIIGLIIIGAVGKMLAPNLTASFGPMIADPFGMILWAYGVIMLIMCITGERKTAMQIIGSVTPMIVLALMIPAVLGEGWGSVIPPIIFMVCIPLIASYGRYLGRRASGVSKEEAVEDFRKEWLGGEEIEKSSITVGNLENVKSAARSINHRISGGVAITDDQLKGDYDIVVTRLRVLTGEIERTKKLEKKSKKKIREDTDDLKGRVDYLKRKVKAKISGDARGVAEGEDRKIQALVGQRDTLVGKIRIETPSDTMKEITERIEHLNLIIIHARSDRDSRIKGMEETKNQAYSEVFSILDDIRGKLDTIEFNLGTEESR